MSEELIADGEGELGTLGPGQLAELREIVRLEAEDVPREAVREHWEEFLRGVRTQGAEHEADIMFQTLQVLTQHYLAIFKCTSSEKKVFLEAKFRAALEAVKVVCERITSEREAAWEDLVWAVVAASASVAVAVGTAVGSNESEGDH